MLKDPWHSLHIGEITRNEAIGDVEEFQLRQTSEDCRYASIEGVSTEIDIFKPLGRLKYSIVQPPVNQTEGKIDFKQTAW